MLKPRPGARHGCLSLTSLLCVHENNVGLAGVNVISPKKVTGREKAF